MTTLFTPMTGFSLLLAGGALITASSPYLDPARFEPQRVLTTVECNVESLPNGASFADPGWQEKVFSLTPVVDGKEEGRTREQVAEGEQGAEGEQDGEGGSAPMTTLRQATFAVHRQGLHGPILDATLHRAHGDCPRCGPFDVESRDGCRIACPGCGAGWKCRFADRSAGQLQAEAQEPSESSATAAVTITSSTVAPSTVNR